MKRFSFLLLLSVGLFAASIFLNACQKEVGQEAAQSVQGVSPVTDRAANHITYGVTLFDGVNPCEIIGLDQGSGNVISATTAFYIDPVLGNVQLDNLKGICLTSWGQYFLTTGSPANILIGPGALDNSLFKVNPITGQCSLSSTNPNGNTVSDLEHDPSGALNFYGLSNNSNAIIEISDNGNNYGTYSAPAAILGIAPGYVLKGLSLVRDGVNGMYLVGCATGKPGLPAKLYTVPALGGIATFMTDLDPLFDLTGGHCAIGFDLDLNNLLVNRTNVVTFTGPGLNDFPWNPPFGATTNTAFWGGGEYLYEDLTSSVY